MLVWMSDRPVITPSVLTRRVLLQWLTQVAADGPARLTLALPRNWTVPNTPVPQEAQTWIREHEDILGRSPTGVFLLWSTEQTYLIEPPLPLRTAMVEAGWQVGPLLAQLNTPYRIGVLLLRRGGYAVGLFEGDQLVVSKVGGRFVKGRHRKGGQSQRRFERIREKQVRELYDAACEVMWEKLHPVVKELDYFFLGGDRHTLQGFMKRCPFPQQLEEKRVGRILNVPEPRRDVLEAVLDEIWKSRVWTF